MSLDIPCFLFPEVYVQLTSFTDYGLRALIYMASLPEGRMTSISEVTEVYGVSRNHMVKIINQLSRMGYVTAVRGKNGGIRLGKPAGQIRVGDVVRDLEPLSLVNCSSEFCHITPKIINGSIKRINNTNLNYLEPHKIIVNNVTFLAFNYSTDIYVGNLIKKIKLVELEDYIKNMALIIF